MVLGKREKVVLAKAVSRLLDCWELSQDMQCELLGLMPSSREKLLQMKVGLAEIPTGRDAFDRVMYLLSIHKCLTMLYPKNEDLRFGWIRTRNKRFDNLSPLDTMLEKGILGLFIVNNFLKAQLK